MAGAVEAAAAAVLRQDRRSPFVAHGVNIAGCKTVSGCAKKAGLDFTVTKDPDPVRSNDGEPVPDVYAVVRDDTKQVLAAVGNRYTVVQNVPCDDSAVVAGFSQAFYKRIEELEITMQIASE